MPASSTHNGGPSHPRRPSDHLRREGPRNVPPEVWDLAVWALGICGLVAGIAAALVFDKLLAAVLAVGAGACAAVLAGLVARGRRANLHGSARGGGPAGGRSANLGVVDTVTGLPGARFFRFNLEARTASARRALRPLSLVIAELAAPDRGQPSGARPGSAGPEGAGTGTGGPELTSFAVISKRTIRESDIACRIGESRFALLLEDTDGEGAVHTVRRLQAAMDEEGMQGRTLTAGIATWPSHGLRPDQLEHRATEALERALAPQDGRDARRGTDRRQGPPGPATAGMSGRVEMARTD
ncbi:MAG: diguanylate cyclase domain-containing protein [Acidimicrobiales bacterium]